MVMENFFEKNSPELLDVVVGHNLVYAVLRGVEPGALLNLHDEHGNGVGLTVLSRCVALSATGEGGRKKQGKK